MPRQQSATAGFGLIELIVVLIILGGIFLLTLKGAALIAPMRAYITVQQLNQYKSAVFSYETDFKSPPGDDSAAPGRWGRTDALYSIGLAQVSYANNGRINGLLDDSGNATGEQYAAWQDLRLGGYVEGDKTLVGQSARPENLYGGVYGFAEDNLGLDQVLCLTRVPGTDALLLDKRLDDGIIATGRVRGTSQWDPVEAKNHFAAPDSAPYDPEKTYIICTPYVP